jgi:hypothetical protein
VKTSVSFKSICIQFALVLSFLLALSPFLHAHYGASKIAGLTSFSQDEEQESAALGVEASYSRQVSLDVEDQPESSLILTFFVMSVLSLQVVFFLLKPDTLSSANSPFSPGFPPLPHAPPTFRA